MNKWTLKFENQPLEAEYQATFNEERNTTTFRAVLLSSLLLYIGKVVGDLTNQAPLEWQFLIPGFVVACTSSYVVFKHPKYSQNALILLNYTFSLAQLWVDDAYSNQRSFVLGSNMMGIQMIIMMTLLDYQVIVPQIVIQCLAKLLIQSLKDNSRIISILFSIIIALCQLIVYNKMIFAQRKQFLLKHKENSFSNNLNNVVKFIPRIVENPFIIFQLKEEKFQPILVHRGNHIKKWDKGLCDGCNLRFLLRYVKKDGISFEKVLLDLIQMKLKQNICETDVFSFTCLGFGFIRVVDVTTEQQKFLVTFQDRFKDQNHLNFELKKINHFYRLIRNLFKYFQHPSQHKTKIIELSLYYLSSFYLRANKLMEIFPIKALNQIHKFIGLENINLSYEQKLETFSIVTEKNQFSIFFLQLFRILILIDCKQDQSKIRIEKCLDNTLMFRITVKIEKRNKFQRLYQNNQFIQNIELRLFQKKLDFNKPVYLLTMKSDFDINNGFYQNASYDKQLLFTNN